jgi:hypothetical protein
MPKLDGFKAQIRECDIEVAGEIIHVRYRPYAITPEMENNRSDPDEMIVALIESWDILDEEGVPIPVTTETVNGGAIPSFLLVEIFHKVRDKSISLGK